MSDQLDCESTCKQLQASVSDGGSIGKRFSLYLFLSMGPVGHGETVDFPSFQKRTKNLGTQRWVSG